MSLSFQFETNLEKECVEFLEKNEIKAFTTRNVENLGINNVQCIFNYEGVVEDTRQRVGNFLEYDLHIGSMAIVVNTYRDVNAGHFALVGKVRACMLNSYNPWKNGIYSIYDIRASNSTTIEDEELNSDQTTLSYTIQFQINFNNLK